MTATSGVVAMLELRFSPGCAFPCVVDHRFDGLGDPWHQLNHRGRNFLDDGHHLIEETFLFKSVLRHLHDSLESSFTKHVTVAEILK